LGINLGGTKPLILGIGQGFFTPLVQGGENLILIGIFRHSKGGLWERFSRNSFGPIIPEIPRPGPGRHGKVLVWQEEGNTR